MDSGKNKGTKNVERRVPTTADDTSSEDCYTMQFASALSAALLMMASSASFAWVSPMTPKLLAPDSPIPMTSNDSGWMVLVLMLGRAASVIPGSWLMDRIGRKKTLLYCAIPISIGYTITLFATKVWHLYMARFLWGLTLGPVHSIVLSMYLGEIGSIKIRGSISTLLGVMAKCGILMSYAVGPYTSLFWFSLISLCLPTLFVITFVWMPESPYWLVAQKRMDDARHSLVRLRGHQNVTAELKRIETLVRDSEKMEKSLWQELLAVENRQSLLIVFVFATAVIMTGTEAMLTYSGMIFIEVGAGIDPSLLNILFGSLLVGTTILSSNIVDRVGRRPLLLWSTIGLILCNLTLFVTFLLKELKVDISKFSLVPMIACMCYIFCYGIGLATVIFAIMAEILPKHLKKLAGIIFGLTISLLSMIVSKLFQVIADYVGHYLIFCGFFVASSLFLPFIYYKIPETKGRPLDEIFAQINRIKL